MKYIDESKAVFDSLEFNQLSSGQIALWFVLFNMCNKAHWPDWFSLASGRLASLAGLSVSGMKKARARLKDQGYIDFKSQGKNKATKYRIISRVSGVGSQDSSQQSNQQSNQQSDWQSSQQSVDKVASGVSHYKDETKTKTKTKKITKRKTAGDAKTEKQIDEVIDYLNEQAHKEFHHSTEATRKVIRARLQKFTVADCKRVIDVKVAD